MRLWLGLQIAFLRWDADCIADEREAYQEAGWVGPEYLAASRRAEDAQRAKARALEAML